jgi:hypothetical protein
MACGGSDRGTGNVEVARAGEFSKPLESVKDLGQGAERAA